MDTASTSDHLRSALSLHQGGELDAAEARYRDIIATHPTGAVTADAWHLLGLIELARDNFAAAIAAMQQAIALNPKPAVYHFNLGNAQRRSGANSQAIVAYRAALELEPHDPDTLNNLALALIDVDDTVGAIDCLTRAHELKPNDAPIACTLGSLLFEQDRTVAAAQYFEQAISSDPEFAEAHNNLGAVHQTYGDLQRAAHCYAQAIRFAPEFAAAHKNLAGVLHLLGRTPEAVAHYREALRLQPDYADAAYELAALSGNSQALPPQNYIAGLFDQYAHEYDTHMTNVLGYDVPHQLRALLAPLLHSDALDILDLGCGTGLSGKVFKDLARHLVGIDLSPKMVAKARAGGDYDTLIVGDVVSATRTMEKCFDLVLAADVFVYLGDLVPIFAAARQVLRTPGLFAFSVERVEMNEPNAPNDDGDADGYTLRAAGRYAHSSAYVRALAAQHDFVEHAHMHTVLRKDYGQDIPGVLWVLGVAA